ncbi:MULTISPECIES: endonuclease/exonuclease/phosphatase family protein [Rhizobium]|uniref:Endonuclease/exonuclease/phosphatase family metal-dependent hydrolase n=1 Tax=Rhizobium tropici TaxID=398 RepID=A0A6P1C5F6_RHITR|nr:MULTISPECIES: endonuclease/exonuclease/phosphatase family protein [Rhizobium]AGB74616.1 putative endonuclease/exonuclease/phosphatase [Rhizobium tropici CIAT 899]MBB4242645.1 endonuclease/exonuclease/phosphatase family metal-dependent hydrolase [Rhizobium tropici]MBB5594450.1 endonuclease/exonuclease/phosphatase family metal-dependent hydrolase [Rhizobium tropici]MBB6492970.1 endonuclease/exonuclease/phosphatase family metal-dependent hydrolase [Rhizobium tropici]NEV10635.1 endonuclease/exo
MRKKKESLRASILESLKNRKKSRPKPAGGKVDRPEGTLIASYNVHKCVGADRRFDPERTSRVIHEIDADIIGLQEADTRFGERTGILDLRRLERETGLIPVPITGVTKAHGWHGNVVLFKQGTVRDVHQINLPGLEPRGALIAELELARGGSLRIIAAHLGLLHRSRAQQTRLIVDLMNDGSEMPTILLGDLNEWRLGDRSSLNTFQAAFGPLPPAVPSFPSTLPLLALDRIMANRRGMISAVEVHDSPLARLASDHLPIKAVVSLETFDNDAQRHPQTA